MEPKRYRVEIQARDSTTWEVVYCSNSLPVAKRYAARLRKVHRVQSTRVVDRQTELVVSYDPT